MRKIILLVISFTLLSCLQKKQENIALESESNKVAMEIVIAEELEEDEVSKLLAPDNYKDCLQEEQDEFVPQGYCQVGKLEGDFNNDGFTDYMLLVQATEANAWQYNQWETEIVNKNRRGVVIVFNDGDRYRVHSQNLSFLDSENEDGGVYYAPELDVSVNKKGIINFHYAHGRYGYWDYLFRYQDDKFELIGFESHSNRGPIPISINSCNFSTMRRKTSVNEFADMEFEDGEYQEKWKDEWSDINMEKRINLTEIENLTDLFASFY